MKHNFKEWAATTRYWSFPVSAMPVLAATMLLAWKGYDVKWLYALLALVGNVLFHAAGNLLSDYWDYRTGVDNEHAYAVPNLVFHKFEPSEYLKLSAVLFSAAILIGLVLTFLSSWKLLVIGGIGAVLAASYSFFKFRSMGDIFVFICFGVLPVLGTSLVAAGTVDYSLLALSLPLGILTVAVLHDNNIVDIDTDRESGIRTLPMTLGERASVKLYIAYLLIPYLAVAILCSVRLLPVTALACFLSFPVALANLKSAGRYFKDGREAMKGLDQATAKLHLIFSLFLSLGTGLAALF